MEMIYIVENYMSGDTFVCYSAEKAKDYVIKRITQYWNEFEKQFHEDDSELKDIIKEIEKQAAQYNGEFDTEHALCYRVPVIEEETNG